MIQYRVYMHLASNSGSEASVRVRARRSVLQPRFDYPTPDLMAASLISRLKLFSDALISRYTVLGGIVYL